MVAPHFVLFLQIEYLAPKVLDEEILPTLIQAQMIGNSLGLSRVLTKMSSSMNLGNQIRPLTMKLLM